MAAGHDAKPEQPEKMNEASAASRQVQVEKERLTRRAALRKFGFGAGMAALMALSTDDLARMAAKKLQQQAGDNRIANAVAMEFKNVGIASADLNSCTGADTGLYCIDVGKNAKPSNPVAAQDACKSCCQQLYATGRCSTGTDYHTTCEGNC